MHRHHVLPAAAILFLIFSLAEALLLVRSGRTYPARAAGASLIVALAQRVTRALQLPAVVACASYLWAHRIASVELPPPAALAAVFVATEFAYYWMHRASHGVAWLWATHSVHHSARSLTFPTAVRLGLDGFVTGEAVFFLPLVWLGFSPGTVFSALGANLLYQFFLHTELVPRLGFLEYVLNTPAHHRVHHATNAPYLNRNFGGVTIVFDRLFGTFAAEAAALEPVYGLVGEDRGDAPLRILFDGWLLLARAVAAAPTGSARVRAILGPPSRGGPARA